MLDIIQLFDAATILGTQEGDSSVASITRQGISAVIERHKHDKGTTPASTVTVTPGNPKFGLKVNNKNKKVKTRLNRVLSQVAEVPKQRNKSKLINLSSYNKQKLQHNKLLKKRSSCHQKKKQMPKNETISLQQPQHQTRSRSKNIRQCHVHTQKRRQRAVSYLLSFHFPTT